MIRALFTLALATTASAAVGASCSTSTDFYNPNSECGPGEFCSWSGNVCYAKLATGETCSISDEDQCAESADSCLEGTCKPPTPNGGACSTSSTCLQQSYCDENDVCAAKKSVGASCVQDGIGTQDECSAGWCNAAKSVSPSVCTAYTAIDAACTIDVECDGTCDSGKCYNLGAAIGAGLATVAGAAMGIIIAGVIGGICCCILCIVGIVMIAKKS